MLRALEQTRSYPVTPAPAGARQGAPSVPMRVAPGVRREFKVIPTLNGLGIGVGLVNVVAFAQSVGEHVAIFVDSAAPAGGLATADLDAMRDAFDQQLYPADTAAFGRESDIDGNGIVIVLMTSQVNRLVTAADCVNSGYVAGFFYGADIDPSSAYLFNNGEIFYTMVADSGATLSCSHPNSQVKRVVPGTLVHEFQHMISYNQHVLVRHARAEVLWLNEAMSHYAEELGGRAFLPDTTTFCAYVSGDLNNAAKYWANPGIHPLVDTVGVGGLPERGEGWLFVRYLVDRLATDTSVAAQNVITRALAGSSLTGTANVAQVTGVPFATTAGEWALANWVSDLPGFAAPNALKYRKWAFRTAYPTLRAACGSAIPATFPLLAAADGGRTINLSGTMMSGSGAAYQRALQGPATAAFNVLFSDGTGAQLKSTVAPRLNVLRIR
jgi:hypothetical protein